MGKHKFWNFIKNEAENTGELQLYGEISDTSWWGDESRRKILKQILMRLAISAR